MAKLFIAALALGFVFMACNSNSDKTKDTVTQESVATDTMTTTGNVNQVSEQLYACSMHPEVTGTQADTCSKCGMKLTVAVKNSDSPR